MAAVDVQPAPIRKRGFWFYLRRVLLILLAVVVVAIAVGMSYEAIAEYRDRQRLSPAGRLVEMGDYKLHLYCSGSERPDDVTVILESGLGGTTSNWARIQNEVEQAARVCSYDRGGIGWSDPSPQPRDGIGIAHELDELLRRAGITGKLVLVGHSSGGIYARAFRSQYPERVLGIVLLDSSHEEQFKRTPEGDAMYKRVSGAYAILPFAARVSLIRLTPLCDLSMDFPAAARENYRAVCAKVGSWKAQQTELATLPTAMQQVAAQPKLDALPLVVVTAGNDPQNTSNWLELQNEHAMLSSHSKHIVRANATHPGLLLDAEDAHQSAAAILELVTSIRIAAGKP